MYVYYIKYNYSTLTDQCMKYTCAAAKSSNKARKIYSRQE
jgi:hypothetical protein